MSQSFPYRRPARRRHRISGELQNAVIYLVTFVALAFAIGAYNAWRDSVNHHNLQRCLRNRSYYAGTSTSEGMYMLAQCLDDIRGR